MAKVTYEAIAVSRVLQMPKPDKIPENVMLDSVFDQVARNFEFPSDCLSHFNLELSQTLEALERGESLEVLQWLISIPYRADFLASYEKLQSMDEDTLNFLGSIAVFSFVGWLVGCDVSKKVKPVDPLLTALLKCFDFKYQELLKMCFRAAVDYYLTRSNEGDELPSVNLLNEYLSKSPESDFPLLLISRLEERNMKPSDPYFSQLLATVVSLVRCNKDMFTRETARDVIERMSQYIREFKQPAFDLFGGLFDKLEEPQRNEILGAWIKSLTEKMSQGDPVAFHFPRKDDLIRLGSVDFNRPYEFKFVDAETYENGFETPAELILPPDTAIFARVISPEVKEKIEMVGMACARENRGMAQAFLDAYVENMRKDTSVYTLKLTCAAMFFVAKLVAVNVRVKWNSIWENQEIFNPNITIFDRDKSDDFQLLAGLRYHAIQLLMNDATAFASAMKQLAEYPMLFTEFMAVVVSLYDNLCAVMSPSLGKLILNIALLYQEIDFANPNETVEMARSQIWALVAAMSSDEPRLSRLLSDIPAMSMFTHFVFETPLKDFVLTVISKYLDICEEPTADLLMQVLGALVAAISDLLPDENATLLLSDILSYVNETVTQGRKWMMKFSKFCQDLCHCLLRLETGPTGHEIVQTSLSLFAAMANYFPITEVEVGKLAHVMGKFGRVLIGSFYTPIVQLVSGDCCSTVSPTFLICQPWAVVLLLKVTTGHKLFTNACQWIVELCNYSRKNVIACCDVRLDLFVLDFLTKAKADEELPEQDTELLLKIFALLTSYVCDYKAISKYIGLLVPKENFVVSKYQKLFLDTLNGIFKEIFNEPPCYFFLNGDVLKSLQTEFDQIENGFTFTCWVFQSCSAPTYSPNLFSLHLGKSCVLKVFVHGSTIFGQIDHENARHRGVIHNKLRPDKWAMVSVAVKFLPETTIFDCEVDCAPCDTLAFVPLEKDIFKHKIEFVIGGGSAETTEYPSRMTQAGLFPLMSKEDRRKIFDLGLRRQGRFVFSVEPYDFFWGFEDKERTPDNIFLTTLVSQVRCPSLLPLLSSSKLTLNGEPFYYQFTSSLQLLASLLEYSVDVQKVFFEDQCCQTFIYLIRKHWMSLYTYNTYLTLYSIFASLSYEPLQKMFLRDLLMSFDLLFELPNALHVRIMKHWSQNICQNFAELLVQVRPLKVMIAALTVYYSDKIPDNVSGLVTRQEGLPLEQCRQLMFTIMYKIAETTGFKVVDFQMIAGICLTCGDPVKMVHFLDFIVNVVERNPELVEVEFLQPKITRCFLAFIQMAELEIRCLTFRLLVAFQDTGKISELVLANFMSLLMTVYVIDDTSPAILDFLISLLPKGPFLQRFCCYMALKLHQKFDKLVAATCTVVPKKVNFLWLKLHLQLYLNCGKNDQRRLLTYILSLSKELWIASLVVIDSFDLDYVTECNFKNHVLSIMGKTFLAEDNAHQAETFLAITQNYLFFRRSSKHGSLLAAFEMDDAEKTVQHSHSCPYGFGLRFDDTGTWLDLSLADQCIDLYCKFKPPAYTPMILLLIGFMYRAIKDSNEMESRLSKIALSEMEIEDHAIYIRFIIYETERAGCRQFFTTLEQGDFTFAAEIEASLTKARPPIYEEKVREYEQAQVKQKATNDSNVQTMAMVDLNEIGQFSLGEGKSLVEREKEVFKDGGAKWRKMWLFLTGTRAPWERTWPKVVMVRDVTRCFLGVPVRLVPSGQNIFRATLEINESAILSTPCQLILGRQTFAVKEMLLTKEALRFRVKTKTELCCLYSEISLIIAKAKNVFQVNTFYGFFYLVVLSPEMDASVLIDHIRKFGELRPSTVRNTLDFSTVFQSQEAITKRWVMCQLSNYEYIMKLNEWSGRSFSLPNVYPIFPVLFEGRELSLTVNGEKSYSRFPINESIVDEFTEVKSISISSLISECRAKSSEMPPELYVMPEFSSLDEVYKLRKLLESPDVSSKLHLWFDLIWSGTRATNPYALYQGQHRERREGSDVKTLGESVAVPLDATCDYGFVEVKSEKKVTKDKTSFVQFFNVNHISFQTKTFSETHIRFKKGRQTEKKRSESFPCESQNCPRVMFCQSRYVYHFQDGCDLCLMDVKKKDVVKLDHKAPISCFTCDGEWTVVALDDPGSSVCGYRHDKLQWKRPWHRDVCTCCHVSRTFHVVVGGMADGAVVISPLDTGAPIRSIPTFPDIPKKILVSPSWGFILVYTERVDPEGLDCGIFVFTINGDFVKRVKCHRLLQWCTWKSADCFDCIATYDERGFFSFSEVYTIDKMARKNIGLIDAVSLNLLTINMQSMFSIVAPDKVVFLQLKDKSTVLVEF